RLTPAERAVLLLHEVFDFSHEEIATLVSRTPPPAGRLSSAPRATWPPAARRTPPPRADHRPRPDASLPPPPPGGVAALTSLLASDAVLITDGGPDGRVFQGVRNLRRPLEGARQIAAFITATAARAPLEAVRRDLNGQPALVFYQEGRPFSAVLLAV